MIPECFVIPFIGLKLACDESSSSGLFINDLEGISFRLATAAAKDDYIKGEELFRSKEKMAIIDTVRDFLLLAQKDFSFKDVLHEQYISGNWSDDYTLVGKFGWELEKCQDNFIALEIPYFTVFPEQTMQITINIEVDGTLKKEVTQTVTGGIENRVLLDFQTYGSKVKVYTDFCNYGAKQIVACNCSCMHPCGACATLRPIEYDTAWTYSSNYKATGQIVCRCTLDHLVCMYKKELALPILYMTGIKLGREFFVTDNVNPFMENRKEQIKELLLIWEGQPTENEYFDKRSEYFKSIYRVALLARNYIKNTKTLCLECESAQVLTHCLN